MLNIDVVEALEKSQRNLALLSRKKIVNKRGKIQTVFVNNNKEEPVVNRIDSILPNKKTKSTDIFENFPEDHPVFPLFSSIYESLKEQGVNPVVKRMKNPKIDGVEVDGYYDPNDNSIAINENSDFSGADLGFVLTHELLHALTVKKLESKKNKKFVETLDNMRDHAKKHLGEKFAYELGSNDEFLVGIYTEPNFIKALEKVPPMDLKKYKNLFEEFFGYLLESLGLRGSKFLDQAVSVSSHIIKSKSTKVKKLKQEKIMEDNIQKAFDVLANTEAKLSVISSKVLEKSGPGNGLIAKKVVVTRGGKSFTQTYYVQPGSKKDSPEFHNDVKEATERFHSDTEALHNHIKELAGKNHHEITTDDLEKLRTLSQHASYSHTAMAAHNAPHKEVKFDSSSAKDEVKGVKAKPSDDQLVDEVDKLVENNGDPASSAKKIADKHGLEANEVLALYKKRISVQTPKTQKQLKQQRVMEAGKTSAEAEKERRLKLAEEGKKNFKENVPVYSGDKKVVGHDEFDHPEGWKIKKGEKVKFQHGGETKEGTVVRTNVYQKFTNPYVLMTGTDGKKYEIVVSKISQPNGGGNKSHDKNSDLVDVSFEDGIRKPKESVMREVAELKSGLPTIKKVKVTSENSGPYSGDGNSTAITLETESGNEYKKFYPHEGFLVDKKQQSEGANRPGMIYMRDSEGKLQRLGSLSSPETIKKLESKKIVIPSKKEQEFALNTIHSVMTDENLFYLSGKTKPEISGWERSIDDQNRPRLKMKFSNSHVGGIGGSWTDVSVSFDPIDKKMQVSYTKLTGGTSDSGKTGVSEVKFGGDFTDAQEIKKQFSEALKNARKTVDLESKKYDDSFSSFYKQRKNKD